MSNTIMPTVFYRTLNVRGLEIFYRETGPWLGSCCADLRCSVPASCFHDLYLGSRAKRRLKVPTGVVSDGPESREATVLCEIALDHHLQRTVG